MVQYLSIFNAKRYLSLKKLFLPIQVPLSSNVYINFVCIKTSQKCMEKNSNNTKVSATIRLYQWFVSTIIDHSHISFSQLNELWVKNRMGEGYPLSRTTFNRYRKGIKELYGIEILCKTGGSNKNKYYIRNKADLYEDSPLVWSMNAMALNVLLYKHKTIRERISIEQSFNMKHLDVIMEAVEKHQILLVTSWDYKRKKLISERVNPYGLILRCNEWFVVSITEGEHPSACIEKLNMDGVPSYQYYMVSSFMKVENTGEKFIQKKCFRFHKAISMAPEQRSFRKEESKKEIELVVNNVALKKIKTQASFLYNIRKKESDKTHVVLYTFGSENAIEFILSLGADASVASPKDIRDSVRNEITEMFHNYGI